MEQKRTRKFFRNLLTLALAGAMCLSATVTSFAEEGEDERDPDVIWAVDEDRPAEAKLTKLLKMPEGTTTPEVKFTFTFEKTEYNESTVQTELDKMPNITNKVSPGEEDNTVEISFTSANDEDPVDGIKDVVLESDELAALANFTEVGVYKYTVTELKPNPDPYANKTIKDAAGNTFRETMDYSAAEYTITFWVKEKEEAAGVYVYAIASNIIKNDAGAAVPGTPKVDPTPGGNPSEGYTYSQMIFTNVYHKIKSDVNPLDPDEPEDPTTLPEDPTTNPTLQSLFISKTVTGTLGEKNKYFAFDVTVEQPATITDKTELYRAYIVDASNVIVTSTDHVLAEKSGLVKTYEGMKYIEVKAGEETTIKLKDGERIVFGNLHVGAKYTVTEAAAPGYTPSVMVKANSVDTPAGGITGNLSEALTIGGGTAKILIGEKTNSAAYTNKYNDVPITGVIVNNLPFILLIAAAVGGFAFFVVVKYRKRENTEN